MGLGASAMGAWQQNEYNKDTMALQHQYNEKTAENNQRRNKDMWDYTNYENVRKHMENAGLNPALLYGTSGGGGATAQGGQGQGVSAQGGQVSAGAQMGGMALQAQQVASQIELNKSAADLNKAEADKKRGVDTEVGKAAANLSMQQGLTEEQKRNVMEAETKLKSAQEWLTNSLASTEQFNLQKVQKELNVMDEQILKLGEETKALRIANKINGETAEIQIKQYYATLANTLADTMVKAAQGTMYEKEATAIGERIRQGDEIINQGNQRITQDWVKVGIQGVETIVQSLGTLGKLGKVMKEIKNFGKESTENETYNKSKWTDDEGVTHEYGGRTKTR